MARYDIVPGQYEIAGAGIGIVAARFNARFVDRLLGGALGVLSLNGVADPTVVRVPGAFEIPLAARRLAGAPGIEAVIALGAVVRGETPHFDYVAASCAQGVMTAGLDRGVPIIFGVLTTEDDAQAAARTGGEHGNKGEEAAHAALEMVTLLRRIPR